jgi:hypothetical protein
MASCIQLTTNLKKEVANAFIDYLKNPNENSWFIAFGNPLPWSFDQSVAQSGFVYSTVVSGDDRVVPLPEDTDLEKYEFYRNCIGMKKISRNDVSLLIPKNEWQQNKIYYPYRYDENMFEDLSKAFYVYNSDNRCIYKCIENNYGLSGGEASGISGSTYKPNSTNLDVFDTGDGYKWKLIYQLSAADELNYSVDGRTEEDSFIPVRYIDFEPDPSETELLKQKSVQDNAVPGSISSVYLNPLYRNLITYDSRISVVGEDDAIYPTLGVSAGATTLTIDYFGVNNSPNTLKNMLLYVVSGPGDGQTRAIKSSTKSTLAGGNYLTIEVDPLDEGLSAYSATESRSALNILPQLRIIGDGEAKSPTASGNSNLESALGIINFASAAGATAVVTGVDLIDIGKNYTYARAFSPKGLTTVNVGENLPEDIFLLSLSPQNGHGSNAVLELGASKILIKTTFEGSENGRIEAINDFRQIALVKNPVLRDKIALVRTIDGVGSGIGTGDSVTLTGSSTLQGTVLRSTPFDDDPGYEYLINGLSGSVGDFDYISGIDVDPNDGFELIEIAGLENKETLVLEATSTVTSVKSRDVVVGVGNKSTGLVPSYAGGKVLRVDGTDVYISPIRGNFKENENVYALERDGTYRNSFTIQNIKIPNYQNYRDTYSTITTLSIQSETNEFFTSSTFQQDQIVYLFEDDSVSKITSNTEYKESAYCFDWTLFTGPVIGPAPVTNTGTLKLVGARPDNFEVGDYILYYRKSGVPLYAQINSITRSEISYGSGEVLYVQNFPAIERNFQTDEEINLIIGF